FSENADIDKRRRIVVARALMIRLTPPPRASTSVACASPAAGDVRGLVRGPAYYIHFFCTLIATAWSVGILGFSLAYQTSMGSEVQSWLINTMPPNSVKIEVSLFIKTEYVFWPVEMVATLPLTDEMMPVMLGIEPSWSSATGTLYSAKVTPEI